ncbi:MAG: energy-coupling factor transporter transmembrane protein EcfT [Clostridiales bacterium]|jgi:energy-coupling factor transport system permease protein|nr:energy-coupling factor transporter transmembrane protein EcfT [Clostridiales bacterium]
MNISIGQYYPATSFIHSMDPRIKLLGTAVYIAGLFTVNSFWGYLFIGCCLCMIIYASRVPPRFMFRGLKALIFILVFTSAISVFFTPGETVLFQFYAVKITLEGVVNAVRMTFRLIMLISGSSVLTLTTTPIKLTDAIEYILKPFKRIKVPAHEIAMMMTIALRFIPTLMEEVDRIMKAQTARGADFDTGGLIKKAKSLIPLLVPLFISAFRRADDLAVAMEARCYRGDINRTKMKVMVLEGRDYKALCWMAGFSAAVALLVVFT